MTLYEHGQVATASARALGLTQHNTSSLAGCPEGTLAIGRQCLLGKRAAASLSDRGRHHFLAIDPERQLGSPSGAWWQHADLKPIEHPSTLREYRQRQFRSCDRTPTIMQRPMKRTLHDAALVGIGVWQGSLPNRLRGVTVVSSGAVSADDPDGDPDEHVRFARYRRAFDEVAPADAASLIARVLTDPDKGMANSAVCEYLDRRAAELLTGPGYPAWRLEMTGAVEMDDFSTRRLDEWTLLRAMTLNEPWDAGNLLMASNWLQLRAAETCSVTSVLDVLATSGRTRRIRTTAESRLSAARRSTPSVPER
ncbi:hypothetical protein AB8A21_13970 [Streptomyces sp. BF23-18]|uniref:hypothetical protein n=1 Tax=Streptomyces sp. BF23-18 TaxID=3240282 RepID=UPI0034E51A66